jgi:ribosomal protein S6--L-glutamate ligase
MRIAIMTRAPECYSSKRLIESCEQRGHEVIVVDPMRCALHMSQNKPMIHHKGEPLPAVDAVIPRIGASITFYGLAVLRQFEMMGAYVANESNGIMRTRDKLRAHQLMSRYGIGMPDTWFMKSLKDLSPVLDDLGEGPYIAKLLEGTHGKGVLKLDSKKNALPTIEALMSLNANLMMQEFIAEAKGEDIRIFVIGNKVHAAMKRTAKSGEFRSNLHLGGTASRVELTPEEKSMALKAVSIMGLSVAGVDLMRSDKGPMVLEVNSSPGLEGIETVTQTDVATAIIRWVERNVHSRGTIVVGRG